MKIPYFIIIMFLCPLALVGQEINLLPEPWKVEKKEGVFTLLSQLVSNILLN